MTPPVVLTIAGSDSGGGAGIQADLKTFAALGAYGVSVLTAITAQNTLGVTAIHPVPAGIVAAQLDAVLTDFTVAAVKVGMIADSAVAKVIAERAAELPNLVVDPVLVSTSGSRLGEAATVRVLTAYARVVTPNREEAAALAGCRAETVPEMAAAAAEIAATGPRAVVVTGSDLAVDVLWDAGRITELHGEPVSTPNNHGSGCTFSSAIAVRLAMGDPVPAAVAAAKEYVSGALRGGAAWRLGAGPGPLNHFSG
ncbi:phosphomethylpyrimidine kinase [Actinoplanes sp. SE50]|uniref:bifunctional hydroxymethylpyrimidine kinase/phosphomethylpyrimidine kinase n=1 Tax=unclassified Actinoplanes TaxID=2626549 RepID=UPI00023ED547|nr:MULTISPECIES: bifunctional hydroxymethylpyrimidine kinase/phosphomethylpyrimidine kinase [unclassified Actinoplanes]AEV81719.1 hydroxymethylpyrimidine kinase [Actinoplanes sp. SE50/110]ATO80120.1 phosphomethylpyrimidine kinase [Actinoplanes sp. SE50]SLL97524.1 hydroxymethylpyrimidine/phosphomethylpyrimidine kinase [Actinoplanes sp. SE50/110]